MGYFVLSRRFLLCVDPICRRGWFRLSSWTSSRHKIESELDHGFDKTASRDDITLDAPPPPGEAPPPPEEAQRLLKVAVIGTPNVGKSTLVNQLLGTKLFAVSPKVHTTIRKAMAVFTEGKSQVVLLDTPGIVPYQYGRKLHLPRQFMTDPGNSLNEVDLIMVMVDAANKRTREQLHPDVLTSLTQHSHLPSVLVLNKVDAVRQKHLLLFVSEMLTGFSDLHGKGKQLTALRGKLRDGTIRGRRAVQAAKLEIERLSGELKKNEKERPSAREFGKDEDVAAPSDRTAPGVIRDRNDTVESTKAGDVTMGYSGGEFERRSSKFDGPAGSHETDQSQTFLPKSPGKPVAKCWPHFSRVFMVSALTGDGVEDLKAHLLSSTKPRVWEYSSSDKTDLSSLSLVEDVIREKLFLHYDLEIPYVTKQENILWEWSEDGKELTIHQNLICQKSSQASILIGPRGGTIQTVIAEAREDIERLLNCTVDLTIYVKTAKKK